MRRKGRGILQKRKCGETWGLRSSLEKYEVNGGFVGGRDGKQDDVVEQKPRVMKTLRQLWSVTPNVLEK